MDYIPAHGRSLSGCGNVNEAPPFVTAFERCAGAFKGVYELRQQLEELADKLVGAEGEASAGGGKPSPEGLLPDLRDQAETASSHIDRCFAALGRIKRALP